MEGTRGQPVDTLDDLVELVRSGEDKGAVLRFIAEQERRQAQRLLELGRRAEGTVGELLGSNLWGAYRGMERALGLADLSNCRRVAMVGCGPFPDSLFCLHDKTEIPSLVGFDHDPAAVASAAGLVARLELDRVTILEADARAIDYSDFDAICCSVFAEPRRQVLARIAATASAGTTLLAREPFGAGLLLFDAALDPLPERLKEIARIEPAGGPLGLAYVALAVTDSRNERSTKSVGTEST